VQHHQLKNGQSNMKHLTCIIFLACLFSGCTYPCAKSTGLNINFIAYSNQEINTFTIKKYSKGSNFSNFIDSVIIDSSVSIYERRNDTLKVGITTSIPKMLADFDYRVLVPATGSVYQITELYEPQKEGRWSTKKIMCVNSIQSCLINNLKTLLYYDDIFFKK